MRKAQTRGGLTARQDVDARLRGRENGVAGHVKIALATVALVVLHPSEEMHQCYPSHTGHANPNPLTREFSIGILKTRRVITGKNESENFLPHSPVSSLLSVTCRGALK